MDFVRVGSIVTVYELDEKEEKTYTIVAPGKKTREGEVSSDTAFAQALMGKFTGTRVIKTADYSYEVEILKVDNKKVKMAADELRKINEKIKLENDEESERRRKAADREAWNIAHPLQGGGFSGK